MISINVREFSHHISKYLKNVKAGERIVLMERNVPVVDLVPHNPHLIQSAWKIPHKRIKLKGNETISETVVKMRREDSR